MVPKLPNTTEILGNVLKVKPKKSEGSSHSHIVENQAPRVAKTRMAVFLAEMQNEQK
jgi:hypothetical protein